SGLRAKRRRIVTDPNLYAVSTTGETLADDTESIELVYHFRSKSGRTYTCSYNPESIVVSSGDVFTEF
ncbi:MAG: hypothetical protein KC473_08590, partial [Candidatus Dadabacteria bacterium]|nr:hypothetical protein [Candidatus Dadabacteria bacterium]